MTARPDLQGLAARPLVALEARQLASWLRSEAGLSDTARLRIDSRQVCPGDVFIAAPGLSSDGRAYIGNAIAAGAKAILWDPSAEFLLPSEFLSGPAAVLQRPLPNARALSGPIAAALMGLPAERMAVTAFTGTNGKTSCSVWLAQLLERDGTPCAVAGTLGMGRWGSLEPRTGGLTTPEAVDLQAALHDWAASGIGALSMEASSVGLVAGRLNGTRIRTAVFTNLTRDHLDYHGSFEAYAQAKQSLFAWSGLEHAVVNCDDPAAERMLGAAGAAVQRIGFRIIDRARGNLPSARVDAWLRATRIEALESGATRVDVDGDWGRGQFVVPVPGRFNVSNALAVAGAALANGLGFEQVLQGLGRLSPVPGRMQTLTQRGAPLVVIDYAHTDDALEQVLAALRPSARARGGRLWCLFGAGGDRDPGKRVFMGAAVARHADVIVVTSDNPRSEDPVAIANALLEGVARVRDAAAVQVQLDRAVAIRDAIFGAHANDVVVVAGKGHESVHEVAGVRHPFSDLDCARAALTERQASPGAALSEGPTNAA